jgi:peptidoglycan/xylan/chitin deacetylase (PgdA/CDA1 family)
MTRLRGVLRAAQGWLPQRHDHLVILAYHLVGGGTDSPVDIPIDRFETHLDELAQHSRVVALEEELGKLAAASDRGVEARPRVAITFDDAYDNFREVVWPRLVERSLPATLFVPVGFVEGECGPPITGTGGLPPISWPALREIVESGLVVVGSHSWMHPDLRRVPGEHLQRELLQSRDTLAERLDRTVRGFCYPRGLWNRSIEREVAAVYQYAVIGGGRAVTRRNLRPHRLWRTPIRRDGPSSLRPLLTARIWVEELLADPVRRFRG